VFLGAAAGALAWGCGSDATRDKGVAVAEATAGSAARPAQIRVDQNENPYGPSPAALAAIREPVAETYRYTDLDAQLRRLRQSYRSALLAMPPATP
jgi:histidinol-phosphate/aromatic aminotransferase/cobyric acid decarboxylase-like protein